MASCDANSNCCDNLLQGDFYSPLCKTGYLTPLQRKKLREKRNLDLSECKDDSLNLQNLKKFKRSPMSRLKKDLFTSRKNIKKLNSKKKVKHISQVQCAVSKFFNKTVDDSPREKKFFKTSPSSRLEKVSFTMPLVFKKNALNNIDKNIKLLNSSSMPLHKENNMLNDMAFENQNDDNMLLGAATSTSPCIIKITSTNSGSEYAMASDSSNDAVTNKSYEKTSQSFLDEKSIFEFDWPSEEILLQRQERARAIKRQSILKELNLPLETENIQENCISEIEAPIKLFPIFNISSKSNLKRSEDMKRNEKSSFKYIKDSPRGGEQMIIDAGQKDIGPKLCNMCNMIYSVGEAEDEKLHSDYHSMFMINLKFPGWKDENVIGEYSDGRVLMVRKSDRSWKLKKIEDILLIANRDLGFPKAGFPTKPDVTFVLFISNEKRVAGCIVAEPISSACKVLLVEDESELKLDKVKVWRIGNWYSSSESVPAVCGINRIWVSREFRRKKVASRMVDCLRCNFIHGHVIGIRELAFTDPSPDGREFAAAYTGSDHFLVYK